MSSLKSIPRDTLYEALSDYQLQLRVNPEASAVNARIVVEQVLKEWYFAKRGQEITELFADRKPTLGLMLVHKQVKQTIPYSKYWRELEMVMQTGNKHAHEMQRISEEEAKRHMEYVLRFVNTYYYDTPHNKKIYKIDLAQFKKEVTENVSVESVFLETKKNENAVEQAMKRLGEMQGRIQSLQSRVNQPAKKVRSKAEEKEQKKIQSELQKQAQWLQSLENKWKQFERQSLQKFEQMTADQLTEYHKQMDQLMEQTALYEQQAQQLGRLEQSWEQREQMTRQSLMQMEEEYYELQMRVEEMESKLDGEYISLVPQVEKAHQLLQILHNQLMKERGFRDQMMRVEEQIEQRIERLETAFRQPAGRKAWEEGIETAIKRLKKTVEVQQKYVPQAEEQLQHLMEQLKQLTEAQSTETMKSTLTLWEVRLQKHIERLQQESEEHAMQYEEEWQRVDLLLQQVEMWQNRTEKLERQLQQAQLMPEQLRQEWTEALRNVVTIDAFKEQEQQWNQLLQDFMEMQRELLTLKELAHFHDIRRVSLESDVNRLQSETEQLGEEQEKVERQLVNYEQMMREVNQKQRYLTMTIHQLEQTMTHQQLVQQSSLEAQLNHWESAWKVEMESLRDIQRKWRLFEQESMAKVTHVEQQVASLQRQLNALEERTTRLEERMEQVEEELYTQQETLHEHIHERVTEPPPREEPKEAPPILKDGKGMLKQLQAMMKQWQRDFKKVRTVENFQLMQERLRHITEERHSYTNLGPKEVRLDQNLTEAKHLLVEYATQIQEYKDRAEQLQQRLQVEYEEVTWFQSQYEQANRKVPKRLNKWLEIMQREAEKLNSDVSQAVFGKQTVALYLTQREIALDKKIHKPLEQWKEKQKRILSRRSFGMWHYGAGLASIFLVTFFLYDQTDVFKSSPVNEIAVTEEQPTIVHAEQIRAISAITTADINSVQTIEGVIIRLTEHEKGHRFLTLSDTTGEITIPLFADTFAGHILVEKGDELTVTGRVKEYNGQLEIVPNRVSDVIVR